MQAWCPKADASQLLPLPAAPVMTGLMQGCPEVIHTRHLQTSEIVGNFVHNLIVWVSEYKLDKLFLSAYVCMTGRTLALRGLHSYALAVHELTDKFLVVFPMLDGCLASSPKDNRICASLQAHQTVTASVMHFWGQPRCH